MGSKSPENDDRRRHDKSDDAFQSNQAGGQPRFQRQSNDGDGCLGDGGGGDDDDGDGNGRVEPEIALLTSTTDLDNTGNATAKKKKRKKRTKKTGQATSLLQQSCPPRVPLDTLFPSKIFPTGELQPHSKAYIDQISRTPPSEVNYEARLKYWDDDGFLQNYRKAAEIHRQTRLWVQDTIQPGASLTDIAEGIEGSVRALLDNAGLESGGSLKSGMGFPTGICLNHQVAHYTPAPRQKPVILQHDDVMTVDFGVHINGWIVDSAFTMAFDPVYDNLLTAVKEATNAGIRTAGVDVRISDVSAAIQETMESYEVDIRGKTYPVKAIRNLTGHNIKQWHIHGGKSIPFIKNSDQTKMEEGEVFAIETFGSTGTGRIRDDIGTYGFGLRHDAPLRTSLPMASAKRLYKTIRDNFGTIVFCRRYLERLGVENYLPAMNCLVSNGIVEQYGPLADVKGSYSAQFEHTFLLRETHKEVFSRGPDY